MDSILDSIKKLLGIEVTYDHFDDEIIMNINSALMKLNQLGVGVEDFKVKDSDDKWSDFLDSRTDLESAKIYVYYQTRMGFDPPNTSFILDAMARRSEELEWRLNTQIETTEVEEEEV